MLWLFRVLILTISPPFWIPAVLVGALSKVALLHLTDLNDTKTWMATALAVTISGMLTFGRKP